MFERFTPDARQVVVYAQDEARRLRHGWIGTDHLLLGVLRGADPAADALRAAGLSSERARSLVEGLVARRTDEVPTGMMPLTQQAKRSFERAADEAGALHGGDVSPAHLLLGILAARKGSAACVLRDARVDTDRVVTTLTNATGAALADYRPDPEAKPEARPAVPGRRRRPRSRNRQAESELERLTDRGQLAFALAQEEARGLRHNWLGTEHLLLGVLREREGLGARVLEPLGVTIEGVRQRVIEIVGEHEDDVGDEIQLTKPARRALRSALREAATQGHDHIATEHLLLGVAQEEEGVAAAVLLQFGADAGQLATELDRLLDDLSGLPPAPELTSLADSFLQVRLRQLIGMVAREHEAALGTEAYERAATLKSIERDLSQVLIKVQRQLKP